MMKLTAMCLLAGAALLLPVAALPARSRRGITRFTLLCLLAMAAPLLLCAAGLALAGCDRPASLSPLPEHAASMYEDCPAADAGPRSIHWWSGNRTSLVDMETADLVDGFCIHYTGPFRPELEAKRGYRQVGCLGPLSCTLPSIVESYDEGARKLCIDPEDWENEYTVDDARNLCNTVSALPGIEVVVYTTWFLWPQDARDVLEDCAPLLLLEMVYCIPEGHSTYGECHDLIVDYLSHYTHRSPGIGLSVYTTHQTTAVVSWELMQVQLDAAIDAAGSWGSPNHTLFIFDGDIMTDEFANQTNRYIVEHPPPAIDNGACTDDAGADDAGSDAVDSGLLPGQGDGGTGGGSPAAGRGCGCSLSDTKTPMAASLALSLIAVLAVSRRLLVRRTGKA